MAHALSSRSLRYKVKARDGRAIRLPQKRWVVLQGTSLTWSTNVKGVHSDVSTQSLVGATCTLPMKSTQNQMTPAMKAFSDLGKLPFMLKWPNGEVEYEFVLAASTSAERTAWANALKEATARAKVDAPTAGWLHKEGGRMSGFSLSAWKKRWFVVCPATAEAELCLKYYESPSSSKPKGVLQMRGSDVFVPKRLKGTGGHTNCFCVTSQNVEEKKGKSTTNTTCTLLSAADQGDMEKWVASLQSAIVSAVAQPARPVAAPAAAKATAKPAAAAKGKAAGKATGGDKGAAAVQAGTQGNLEQLKLLDADTLGTLRIKQLKAVLEHMGVDSSDAVEKTDLVSLIVQKR